MKVLTAVQIREADAYTIANEPISSADLMERAATQCYKWTINNLSSKNLYLIFCGTGNNGGDGLVMTRLLLSKNYKVEIYIVKFSDKCSSDFETNLNRLKKYNKVKIFEITNEEEIPEINKNDIVIDAIFGSGLNKPVKGFTGKLIKKINKSDSCIVSIDLPSGLFSEDNSENNGCIIEATHTLTFQFPKLASFFASNSKYLGDVNIIDIGLHKEFINTVKVDNYYTDKLYCKQILKKRAKFSHKGTYGHSLFISGSYGKMGAAVLGGNGCLRSGCGLLTIHIPKCGYNIAQTSVPEAMVSIDENESYISQLPDIFKYDAIAMGPGIATNEETQKVLNSLIKSSQSPLILDADALNILAENPTWISFLPPHTILTPHPKEFDRLVGKTCSDYERWELQKNLTLQNNIYIILKGANTSITCPDGTTWFNSTGNPGMATGGSGDVLTGILLGLLSQGYSSKEACILGVYLHGLAGDFASKQKGYESLIASDLYLFLGKAFKSLY